MDDLDNIANKLKAAAPDGHYVLKSCANVRLMRQMGPFGTEVACFAGRRVSVSHGRWSQLFKGRGWAERVVSAMLEAA